MRMWITKISDGPHLEQALNDMEDEGYDVFGIYTVGSTLQQNRIDPKAATLNPFLVIVGRIKLSKKHPTLGLS